MLNLKKNDMYARKLIKVLEDLVEAHGDCRVFDTIRDEVDEVVYEEDTDSFFSLIKVLRYETENYKVQG